MSLDIFFRSDVAHGITATAIGMLSASAANGPVNVEYVRGVLDKTRADCIGFGIPWPPVVAELKAALKGSGDLLDTVARLTP